MLSVLPLSYYHMVPCLLASMLLQKILSKIFNSKKISPAKGDPLTEPSSALSQRMQGRGDFYLPYALKSTCRDFHNSLNILLNFGIPEPANFYRTASWGWPREQGTLMRSMAITKLPIFKALPSCHKHCSNGRANRNPEFSPLSLDPQPCSSASLSQEGTGNSEVLLSTSLLNTLK